MKESLILGCGRSKGTNKEVYVPSHQKQCVLFKERIKGCKWNPWREF